MSGQFVNFRFINLDDMDLLLLNNQQQTGSSSSSADLNAGIMSTLIMPANSQHYQAATGATSNYLFNSNPNLSTYKFYEPANGEHASWSADMDPSSLSHSMDPLILMDSSSPPPPQQLEMDSSPNCMFQPPPLPSINTLSIQNTDQFDQNINRPLLQKPALVQYSPSASVQMNVVAGTGQDLANSGGQFMVVNHHPPPPSLDQTPAPARYDFTCNHLRQLSQPPAQLVSQQSLPILLHPTSMRASCEYHGQPDTGRLTNHKPVNTPPSAMSPSISSVSSCSSFSSYSAVSTSSSSGDHSVAATKPTAGLTPRLDQLNQRPQRPNSQQPSFAHRSSLPLPLFSNVKADNTQPYHRALNRPANSIQQYDSSLLFDRVDLSDTTNLSSSSSSSKQYRGDAGQVTSQDEEFQIDADDDFNLPTPTTDDKSLISHSSLSTPPPVFTSSSSSRSTHDPFDDTTPSSSSSKLNLPLLDQLNLSSHQSNSYNNFLNSSFSPASFITNAATGQLGFVSRSNSQPDLTLNLESRLQPIQPNSAFAESSSYANASGYHYHYANQSMSKSKGGISRHPSLTCKTSIDNDEFFNTFNIFDYLNPPNTSQANSSSHSAATGDSTSSGKMTTPAVVSSNVAVLDKQTGQFKNYDDDNIFLGTDALSDFLSNCGTFSELLDNLPDLEDYMSLVTFETSGTSQSNQPAKQTLCDLALPSSSSSSSNMNGPNGGMMLSCFNYADDDSRVGCSERNDRSKHMNGASQTEDGGGNFERVTRSAPPSPTPQRKKQRPTGNNLPWQKAW